MRRLFSNSQKKHLYIAAGGRCERCGEALSDDWEAHHRTRYADGGTTEITNGMALCRACHKSIHGRTTMTNIQPRGWQKDALPKVLAHSEGAFLLEACPGAGKTIFSGLVAREMLDDGTVDFALIVVPTTALKGDKEAGFLGDWHKTGVQITTTLKTKAGPPPKGYQGAVVTYAQLPNLAGYIETWRSLGVRILVVFDEVHHACDENTWGVAADRVGEASEFVLAMSGTPFRGDGRRIAFVQYDDNQVAIPHAKYTYRRAVADRVCREVFFAHDNGVADYVIEEDRHSVRISDAESGEVGRVAAVVFHQESDFLKAVIQKADAKLDEYEAEGRGYRPGGIVICRPGADDNDDRHLHQVAKTVRRVTGESPVVITHDDPEANLKIEQFRKGETRWLCSVRKVSEGVDIKRLRVQVLASVPGTELLFRQLVGRVVRVIDRDNPEEATVFMARFAKLEEWAKRIEAEAQAGLRERTKREAAEGERDKVEFSALGATHEHDGGVAMGEQFTAAEINHAERLKAGDPKLAGVPVAVVAHILRKEGVEIPEIDEIGEPLHARKKALRNKINRLARTIALRLDPDKPAFASVWVTIHKRFGVKNLDDLCDNHPIETMAQVEEFLKAYTGGQDNAAA